MTTTGGLKLTLEASGPNDREIRNAQLMLARSTGGETVALVTDARGQMRYRLNDGDCWLSVPNGPSTNFRVEDHRWTSVRLRLG